jgi:prolyl-tRNA editing enzyme YbaK/EbsC (Cys-tRNA(Pro) deacylase)
MHYCLKGSSPWQTVVGRFVERFHFEMPEELASALLAEQSECEVVFSRTALVVAAALAEVALEVTTSSHAAKNAKVATRSKQKQRAFAYPSELRCDSGIPLGH